MFFNLNQLTICANSYSTVSLRLLYITASAVVSSGRSAMISFNNDNNGAIQLGKVAWKLSAPVCLALFTMRSARAS